MEGHGKATLIYLPLHLRHLHQNLKRKMRIGNDRYNDDNEEGEQEWISLSKDFDKLVFMIFDSQYVSLGSFASVIPTYGKGLLDSVQCQGYLIPKYHYLYP